MWRFFASLVITSSFLLAAPSSDKSNGPDLSGKWKANIEKSIFPGTAPQELTAVIKDNGQTIQFQQTTIGLDGNRETVDFKFDKTGKETVNTVRDTELRSVMKSDGEVIRETTEFSTPNGRFSRRSAITMSPDGKTMTLDGVYIGMGPNDVKIRIVLEKQ